MCGVFSYVLYRLDAPDLLGLDKGPEHPGDWGRKLCVVCLNMECTSTPSGRLARMDLCDSPWDRLRHAWSLSVCPSVRPSVCLSNLRTKENSNFSTFRSSERKNRERCFRYRYWKGGGPWVEIPGSRDLRGEYSTKYVENVIPTNDYFKLICRAAHYEDMNEN